LTLVILCGFAVTVGILTSGRIRSDFNRQIAASADYLRNRIKVQLEAETGRVVGVTPNLDLFAAGRATIRVVTRDGAVLAQSNAAPELGPPFEGAATETAGYRVETREIPLSVGSVFVQYGRRESELDATVNKVRLFLLLGVLAGAGLALLAGLMIARRAMAPIAALTSAAHEIEVTRDPTRAVPQTEADDEVAELARTLDGMLRSLSDARLETETTLARQRQFVADASHELRTPLTSVLANLELLAESLTGEQGEAARSALRSSRRMRRLVGDLLLLARADVGRPGQREPTDLAQVAIEAAGELGPLAADHELELAVHPAWVQGSRDELLRLMLNLIENAIRHTPAGTPICVRTGPHGAESVQLVVEDRGPGVAAELAPRLFERFVRGAGDQGGSFGIGLAIVRSVAESHGGRVTYETRDGGGARFVVSLPGQTPAPQAGATAPASAASPVA
jgi:signal transduction histidine kinase